MIRAVTRAGTVDAGFVIFWLSEKILGVELQVITL